MSPAPSRQPAVNPLVGIWHIDEGYQITTLLFRSSGRYQLDTRSTDPSLDYSSSERGRYDIDGEILALAPYDYFGEPFIKRLEVQLADATLTLTRADIGITEVYRFQPGSSDDVVAGEHADPELIGAWQRSITFWGTEEYTFRPGGYYFVKSIQQEGQFPPEFVRGRYERDGALLTLTPYSGTAASFELDFFGTSLTVVRREEYSGQAATYEQVPGSPADVRARAEEADAFLRREHWHAGTWEVRDDIHTVDLTFRPDGHYIAEESTQYLEGIVRGRYTLEPGRIHLIPFVGQGLYARSNGEFGKVERTRALDYFDGELQFIDLESLSQSVTLARKRPGSETSVLEKVRQARAVRELDGWQIGLWEVNDPAGWIEVTWRPDRRYIVKSGSNGVPSQVERGRYVMGADKVTLAPYTGLGAARGFDLDFYDGDLFLVGDMVRLVVARKLEGSDASVIRQTIDPESMKGERGSILGLWTAPLPGQSFDLVFRPDGQFRLTRCTNGTVSHDYGLYSADMHLLVVVYDSRFAEVQTLGLDFYGNTLTLFGSVGGPSTYRVNLGSVDASIEASLAADAQEALIDAVWLRRVPIGPRDPDAIQVPTADVPADPNPGRIFEAPTVVTTFQLYRRLVPGFVYFNDQGVIRTVPVLNSREWHFFPTGRVMVRFRNHRAGFSYPATLVDVSDTWGAYRVEPRPAATDILHLYADNVVIIETDAGEQAEMTLEDGRRHLFWRKDYQILSEWAAEQTTTACSGPDAPDPSLMNTGVTLSTTLPPDHVPDDRPADGGTATSGCRDETRR